MTYAEFTALLPEFEAALTQYAQMKRAPRQRQEGGGRKHPLATGRKKLLFIVFFVKCYTTVDVLAWLFDVDRAQTHRWVTAYVPILEQALGRKAVLPARKIATVEECLQRFPQVKEVFVDGTEHPIRLPTGQEAQRPYYSGKKKGYRVKNVVMTRANERGDVLSETFSGHIHDKTGAIEHGICTPIPDDVLIHMDLGFFGVPKDRPKGTFSLPEKTPKGRPLPDEANARHREKARRRVLVEHALSGVKRFHAMIDTLRSSVDMFADRLMVIACGLWNLHLDMAN